MRFGLRLRHRRREGEDVSQTIFRIAGWTVDLYTSLAVIPATTAIATFTAHDTDFSIQAHQTAAGLSAHDSDAALAWRASP